jgi:hypothetical protein
MVDQRAGISRKTLSRVERGDSAVALGIYARVMQVLRLEDDLAKLAADDPLGRKLRDTALSPRSRAPKRSAPLPPTETDKPKEFSRSPPSTRCRYTLIWNELSHESPRGPDGSVPRLTKTARDILFAGRLWVHTFHSPDERAAGKATVVTDVTVAPVQIAAFPGI